MSIIQELNNKMPACLNTNDTVYQALFGKEDFTPAAKITSPDDYGCGAVANEFEYLYQYINDLCAMDGIDKLERSYLDILVGVFTTLKRFWSEDDTWFRKRFYAILRRNGNKRWDTPWSIVDVFSYYFDRERIFLIENPPTENKLVDGDFESSYLNAWQLSQSGDYLAELTNTDPFNGTWAMGLVSGTQGESSISQAVTLASGANSFGFMMRDTLGDPLADVLEVRLRRGDGKYYDFSTRTWGDAVTGARYKSSSKYKYQSDWVILSAGGDITISFHPLAESCSVVIDDVWLGPHPARPTIKLVIQTYGQDGEFMSAWPGDEDPLEGLDYEETASYLDQAFIGGSGVGISLDKFEKLLKQIKTAGVLSNLEIISAKV